MALLGGLGISGGIALAKGFLSANKYIIMAALLVAASVYGYYKVNSYLDDRDEQNQQVGYQLAEKEFTDAVNAANKVVEEKNTQLAAMNIAFDKLAEQRTADVNIAFDPIIRSITDEIAQDPIYRTCVVSDSVRNNINAGRASVNEAIDATTPSPPRSRPTEALSNSDGGNGRTGSRDSNE